MNVVIDYLKERTCPRPPEDAQTWRDLIDQLTAEQIAELEHEEREGSGNPRTAGSLRFGAESPPLVTRFGGR